MVQLVVAGLNLRDCQIALTSVPSKIHKSATQTETSNFSYIPVFSKKKLASQDALEVMYVSQSVSDSVSRYWTDVTLVSDENHDDHDNHADQDDQVDHGFCDNQHDHDDHEHHSDQKNQGNFGGRMNCWESW